MMLLKLVKIGQRWQQALSISWQLQNISTSSKYPHKKYIYKKIKKIKIGANIRIPPNLVIISLGHKKNIENFLSEN